MLVYAHVELMVDSLLFFNIIHRRFEGVTFSDCFKTRIFENSTGFDNLQIFSI